MPTPPSDSHTQLALYSLSKLGQRSARLAESTLSPFGVRPREYSALALIDELNGSAQSDVADRLGIDRSDMVAIIDKLVGLGLVSRSPDPDDRRRHVVAATTKGRSFAKKGAELLGAAEAEFLGGLSKTDQRQLRKLLDTLSAPDDRI